MGVVNRLHRQIEVLLVIAEIDGAAEGWLFRGFSGNGREVIVRKRHRRRTPLIFREHAVDGGRRFQGLNRLIGFGGRLQRQNGEYQRRGAKAGHGP